MDATRWIFEFQALKGADLFIAMGLFARFRSGYAEWASSMEADS
jgi:hypothetical protein